MKKILVLEDSEYDKEIIIMGINRYMPKVNVIHYESSKKLLEYMSSPDFEVPDLFICDYCMDGADGSYVIECISKGEYKDKFPIVIYTTVDETGLKEYLKSFGKVELIRKASKATDMIEQISTIVKKAA